MIKAIESSRPFVHVRPYRGFYYILQMKVWNMHVQADIVGGKTKKTLVFTSNHKYIMSGYITE